MVAQVLPRHRPHVRRLGQRVAHPDRAHPPHHPFGEVVGDGLVHDHALGRNAALAAVEHAPRHARLHRRLQVGVLEHHVGIAASQLQHARLDLGSRNRGHLPARPGAPGERHRLHPRVAHQVARGLHVHEEIGEHPAREPGGREEIDQLERAARHAGGVLEQHPVARDQGGSRRAHHLPEREVPRHDREHQPQRREGHVAAPGLGLDRLVLQEAGTVAGVVLAAERALLHLGGGLAQRLAHLHGHDFGQMALAGAEANGELGHAARPLPGGQRRPRLLRIPGPVKSGVDGVRRHEGIGAVKGAVGGVDGGVAHAKGLPHGDRTGRWKRRAGRVESSPDGHRG